MKKEIINDILKTFNINKLHSAKDIHHIDDDISIYAEKHNLDYNTIHKVLLNNMVEYESCWGCRYIDYRLSLFGHSAMCESCSRKINTTDNYIPDENDYK